MSDLAIRVRDLFQYGSLNKRVFVSPDLESEVRTEVECVFGTRGITVEVPETWTAVGKRPARNGLIVAWDTQMQRPDIA